LYSARSLSTVDGRVVRRGSANLLLPGLGAHSHTRTHVYAHVRVELNVGGNMQKVISQKACQANAVRAVRQSAYSDRPAVFSRAHQNHNIIYNPSIFGRRNICTAVPLINILSYNISRVRPRSCIYLYTFIFHAPSTTAAAAIDTYP